MNRLKDYSGLLISFTGGLLVASMAWTFLDRQAPEAMPAQTPANAQPASIPLILGDSIQLPNTAGMPAAPQKPVGSPEKIVSSKKQDVKSQPEFSSGTDLPIPEEVLNPPEELEMVELPLDSEITGEAPEPEYFDATTDMADSETFEEVDTDQNARMPMISSNSNLQ
ncbi:MAG: hypothetical protein ACRESZ_18225 [Methylococcales bacterium]